MSSSSVHEQWPLIKRLFELYNGASSFREDVERDRENFARNYRLCPVSEELARILWQKNSFTEKYYSPEEFPQLHSYLEHQNNLRALRNTIRKSCSPEPKRFRAWRTCQMNRCSWQLGSELNDAIIHMPICFELSRGCSVGCWFCGLNAPKLTSNFDYSPANRILWREILNVCRELLGKSASHASLFWATEPFDNPHYEKFCLDFHSILDVFPQTTTALPLANVDRTRRLLKLATQNGCQLNRFSIHSVENLLELHRCFTAEELAGVELIIQAQGSKLKKARTGRILNGRKENLESRTISCATGFLVNMVDRSITLISPWPADRQHPNGYRVYNRAGFTDAEHFSSALQQMIATSMPDSFSSEDRIRLTPGVHCFAKDRKTCFSSDYREMVVEDDRGLPDFHQLIGSYNAGEIALHYLETEGTNPSLTFIALNCLLRDGVVLAEETQ